MVSAAPLALRGARSLDGDALSARLPLSRAFPSARRAGAHQPGFASLRRAGARALTACALARGDPPAAAPARVSMPPPPFYPAMRARRTTRTTTTTTTRHHPRGRGHAVHARHRGRPSPSKSSRAIATAATFGAPRPPRPKPRPPHRGVRAHGVPPSPRTARTSRASSGVPRRPLPPRPPRQSRPVPAPHTAPTESSTRRGACEPGPEAQKAVVDPGRDPRRMRAAYCGTMTRSTPDPAPRRKKLAQVQVGGTRETLVRTPAAVLIRAAALPTTKTRRSIPPMMKTSAVDTRPRGTRRRFGARGDLSTATFVSRAGVG